MKRNLKDILFDMEEGKIETQQAVAEIRNVIKTEGIFSIDCMEESFIIGRKNEIDAKEYLDICLNSNKLYYKLKYD